MYDSVYIFNGACFFPLIPTCNFITLHISGVFLSCITLSILAYLISFDLHSHILRWTVKSYCHNEYIEITIP